MGLILKEKTPAEVKNPSAGKLNLFFNEDEGGELSLKTSAGAVIPVASAYQVALAAGFVGTREQWLATLQGAPGEQGEPGEEGDRGPQGIPGAIDGGKVYVDDFMDSAATDGGRINAALTAAKIDGSRDVVLAPRTYTLEAGETIYVDVAQHSLIGQRGTVIDCPDHTGNAIWIYHGSNPLEGLSGFGNSQATALDSIRVNGPIGPSSTDLSSVGIFIEGNNGPPRHSAARFNIRNVAVSNFGRNVKFGNNSYCVDWWGGEVFEGIFGISFPSTTTQNAGERINFHGTTIYGNVFQVEANSPALDLYLISCSLDYANPWTGGGSAKRKHIDCPRGRVTMLGGHIEDSYDDDYWVQTGDATSRVALIGTQLHLGGNKTLYEIFSVRETGTYASSAKFGGLALTDIHWHAQNRTYNLPLVAGYGRVKCSGYAFEDTSGVGVSNPFPAISRYMNLVDGSFDSANAMAAWSTRYSGAGSEPAIDAGALKFATPDGGQSHAFVSLSIVPGEVILLTYKQKGQGLSSTFRFNRDIRFRDAKGLQIGAAVVQQVTTDGDYTYREMKPLIAPAGAASVDVSFFSSGAWGVGAAVWLEDLILNTQPPT